MPEGAVAVRHISGLNGTIHGLNGHIFGLDGRIFVMNCHIFGPGCRFVGMDCHICGLSTKSPEMRPAWSNTMCPFIGPPSNSIGMSTAV